MFVPDAPESDPDDLLIVPQPIEEETKQPIIIVSADPGENIVNLNEGDE